MFNKRMQSMFTPAPQSPFQPQAGQVSARALTSSVKRSVLAMSMRFSYDARVRAAVSTNRSISKWAGSCTTSIPNSVQEFRLTRNTPLHA